MSHGTSPDPAPQIAPAHPPRRAGSPLASLARNVLPWLIAVGALTWVARSVLGLPPQKEKVHALVEVFAHVPLARYIVASTVLLFLNCAADSLAMFYTFGWFGCHLRYREIFVVRAATYILAVVQYYVGQAAILGYLYRRYRVPLARATGWILFISGINMGVLVILAAIGLVGGDARVPWLRFVPIGVGAGALLYALVLHLQPRRLAREIPVLEPLFDVGIAGHVKATLIRLPHVLVLILWHFLSLRWFGVRVPPFTALVLLPAVFFAAALPISVQGLGLSQVTAVYFFSGYAPAGKAAVLAYSLAMTTVSLIVQILMGISFLPLAKRLGLSAEADATRDPSSPASQDGASSAMRVLGASDG